jgi:hypothetical protein
MRRGAGDGVRTGVNRVPGMAQGEPSRAVAATARARSVSASNGNSPVVPITQMPCTPPSIRKSIKRRSDAWSTVSSGRNGVNIGQKMP